MIFAFQHIRGVEGYGQSFNDGWFPPDESVANPPIPFLPLIRTGDPAPSASVIVTWFEAQSGAIATTSFPAHLLLQPSRGARMATLLRF